ncbi:MAG: uracil-DNA glycosylase, partial [Deinococcus sp.]|nr:uracil-DNA glycosylase [Deinococcus sp.]
MQPLAVVWFKKDLRVSDHAALSQAAERGPVLPLYIYEPEQLGHEEFAGHHLTYLNECLRDLSASLARLGAPLVIRRGEAVAVLDALSREVPIASLWAHQETGNGVSFARDRRVHAWARARGIPFYEPPQQGVIRRMVNRDGWADAWEERMGAATLPVPVLRGPLSTPASLGVLDHAALGVPPDHKVIPQGGEAAACDVLDSFLQSRGRDYMWAMSSPLSAEDACSRLSAPLAFGTVSARTVLLETRQGLARAVAAKDARWERSLRSFESRLHWRDHFIQRLESEPRMEFENLNRAYDGLREPHWNEDYFQRWCEGQTGYPLIDACMRMLRATGWLNFRMRAMLVSFAAQHLWLHWRRPGLFLARQWLDNEPGIHWSQMQMQSGTVGINRSRIYSPTRQAREQDPEGEFIRRWVPELEGVPAPHIWRPWELPPLTARSLGLRLGRDYPYPVVDEHAPAHAAHRRLQAVRETPLFAAEARRVYALHGSRKKAVVRAEREKRGLPPRSAAERSRPTARPSVKPPRRHPMSDQPSLFDPPAAQPAAELPQDWGPVLAEAVSRPSFHRLLEFVAHERQTATVYPPEEDLFTALRLTPYREAKVLILGQDPYHGAGQAHGLAFSVRRGVRVPPSLRNIYQELREDVGVTPPRHGNLAAWAERGVLLLNAVLTVREGEPNSHAGQGWEDFTDAVIRALNDKEERVVFVLWGAYARKKKKLVTAPQHTVIESGHPSPLSVRHFAGSRPFSAVNRALEEA